MIGKELSEGLTSLLSKSPTITRQISHLPNQEPRFINRLLIISSLNTIS